MGKGAIDPDLEFVRRCQRGDMAAFGELVRRHQQPVFNFCVRFLKNAEDAEDIAQETFVQAYRSIKRFRPKAKFSTWLFTIARNLSLNLIRDEKRGKRYMVSVDDEESGVNLSSDAARRPDREASFRETSDLVRNAVDRLSPDHKMMVVLRDLEGLSYEEVAEVLGCRVGTVKSRLSRARSHLKEIIVRDGELI
jgi:RNA polymerase sigma-70 factor (ECF subfamily)